MKRLFAVAAVLALNGCAVWDAYMMTGYDANEYRLITEIRVDAITYKTQCATPLLSQANAQAIAYKTLLFEKYSEHIPRNDDLIRASKNLNEIAQGLADRYAGADPVSPMFCRLKYSGIENSAALLQHTVARRPR
jgi:hypothetical protein